MLISEMLFREKAASICGGNDFLKPGNLSLKTVFRHKWLCFFIILGSIASLSPVPASAQLNTGISYVYSARGYQWGNTSSSPQIGIGVDVGGCLYHIIPSMSLNGRIELQIQRSNYTEVLSFNSQPRLNFSQRVHRIGTIVDLEKKWQHLIIFGGMGAGVDYVRRDVIELGGIDITWVEVPQDRKRKSRYLVAVLGMRVQLLHRLHPYIEYRWYTSRPDEVFKSLRNRIQTSFHGFHMGLSFIIH